ncbi:MAG: hypothetical protein A3H96_01655 [Acidobacteria bacterium RIFCSPLOWO2_02_FULL_67_36]|nr:MAG: hypothetical protein A3H96_01655 [Acidobacteria bacterium RIFCSPLOWO2_02_FULL_67_36]OFW19909.1 MAG: hypothetical protein A3G21_09845 [Acidobacteria bacterium RIFCSPLOWO2_12_FULL_66_21]
MRLIATVRARRRRPARSSRTNLTRASSATTRTSNASPSWRSPTPQGYEFWHALKALGVPTELVIYENEGHFIAKAEHQRDILRRMVGWFDKYL